MSTVTELDRFTVQEVEELARINNIGTAPILMLAPKSVVVPDVAADGSFWLGSLQHPTLRLRNSICLQISTAEGQVVLEWAAANSLFGYGERLSAAVTDFRLAVVELYESIHGEPAEALGSAMLAVREVLEKNIGPVVGA